MMTMGAVTARLKACNRQQCARKAYDASSPSGRDHLVGGAAASKGARPMTVALLMLVVLIVAFGAEVGWLCRC
jgi:hypothetical protein